MTLRDIHVGLTVQAAYSLAKDAATAQALYNFVRSVTLADGTGANQADKIYAKTRTILASQNEDLDLAGGGLVDDLGVALTFVKVRGLFVAAAPGNTNAVVVGGAAATQWVGPFGAATHTIAVPPGMPFAIANADAGWAVGAGTSDLLRVANGGAGTPVTYTIIILGTSA
jgi:hypothetical protein